MNLLHTIAVYGTLCKALNVGAMRCAPGPYPRPRVSLPLRAWMQQGTLLCCSILHAHVLELALKRALEER